MKIFTHFCIKEHQLSNSHKVSFWKSFLSSFQNGGHTTTFSTATQKFTPQLREGAANMKYVVEVNAAPNIHYSRNNIQLKFPLTNQKSAWQTYCNDVTQVQAERNRQYRWRNIPYTQSCSVLATPLPPRNITSVSVSGITFDRGNRTLNMMVELLPSHRAHGILEGYMVSLRRSLTDCYECDNSNTLNFLVC